MLNDSEFYQMLFEGEYSKSSRISDQEHEEKIKEALKRSKKWDCIYPNCNKKGIFSHAISKSNSLTTISENQHLKCLESKRKVREKFIIFGDIGVNDATAFNGFCADHDAMFNEIDNNEISTYKHLLMQCYRAVSGTCVSESRLLNLRRLISEKQAENIEIKDVEELIERINNLSSSQDASSEFAPENINNDVEYLKSSFKKISESESREASEFMELPRPLLKVIDSFDDLPIEKFNIFYTDNFTHQIIYRRLDFKVPVALNGSILHPIGNSIQKFFFIIVPYENTTFLIGVFPKACPKKISDLIVDKFSSDASSLDFIELLLVCCDDWYIAPSVIKNMSSIKRDIFLRDCHFRDNIEYYKKYEMTIFDDLRREMSIANKDDIYTKRVDLIPQREPDEIRYKKMIRRLCGQSVEMIAS